jgi:hypothetical protein
VQLYAPDDGRRGTWNMLSHTYTSSNKLVKLLHLVGWFIWIEVSVNFTVCSSVLLETMIIVYMKLVLNLAHMFQDWIILQYICTRLNTQILLFEMVNFEGS